MSATSTMRAKCARGPPVTPARWNSNLITRRFVYVGTLKAILTRQKSPARPCSCSELLGPSPVPGGRPSGPRKTFCDACVMMARSRVYFSSLIPPLSTSCESRGSCLRYERYCCCRHPSSILLWWWRCYRGCLSYCYICSLRCVVR